MGLLPARQVFDTNVDLTVSGVAERGGILSFVPGVNGLGAYANAAAVSGQIVEPAGLLLDDVEALNFFNHPEYRQRNVVPQGSVVGIATEGEFWTDFVETTLAGQSVGTYAPGDVLYLADDGKVSRNNGTLANGATAKRKIIGRALSELNSDSYLKIRVEL
jgi:hypothetical protein